VGFIIPFIAFFCNICREGIKCKKSGVKGKGDRVQGKAKRFSIAWWGRFTAN